MKYGVKFGASASNTQTKTYSVKTTLNSDNLGEATLTFDQPIIIYNWESMRVYATREISTGWVDLGIDPKKMW